MTAQKLRDAAARIRETAQAATPGRWVYDQAGPDWVILQSGSTWPQGTDEAHASTYRRADAEHVVTWSPPVALAVADWLNALADELGYGFVHADTLKAATALADLILAGAR